MRKTEEQLTALLDMLRLGGQVTLAEAMAQLSVSQSTARRLFDRLQNQGTAVRIHGGIRSVPDREYSYERVEGQRAQEKALIARRAAAWLEPGDTVYLDSGTTLAQVCLCLSHRLQAGELTNINIFTNSLVNLDILGALCPVTLAGGLYRPHRRDFSGYLAEEGVKKLHFNKCILGTDGYDPRCGFTTTDFDTARLNEWVVARSDAVMVAADSSKFSAASVVSYADERAIRLLVTDSALSPATEARLSDRGIEIWIAPPA